MRNKKTFVSLFVILALLCLGIGYATISETLRISGRVQTGEEEDLADNFIVYFSDVETNTTLANDATVTTDLDPAAKTTSTSFSIQNMSKVGSKVVLIYTVQNDSVDLYANSPTIKLNGTTVNANEAITVAKVDAISPFFAITVTPNMVNGQAAPKSTHTITIVIEMIKTPLSEIDFTFKLDFVYEASSTANS